MSAIIFDMHGRCVSCRKPLAQWRTVLDNLCDGCFTSAADYMDRQKVIFEGLLTMGIDRETANVMMIAKHEHERRASGPDRGVEPGETKR